MSFPASQIRTITTTALALDFQQGDAYNNGPAGGPGSGGRGPGIPFGHADVCAGQRTLVARRAFRATAIGSARRQVSLEFRRRRRPRIAGPGAKVTAAASRMHGPASSVLPASRMARPLFASPSSGVTTGGTLSVSRCLPSASGRQCGAGTTSRSPSPRRAVRARSSVGQRARRPPSPARIPTAALRAWAPKLLAFVKRWLHVLINPGLR